MSDENSRGPQLPISGILIFLAALGVSIFTQAPFKNPRPAVPELREPYEKVNARLWQDPFRAVLDHVGSKADGNEFAKKSGVFGLYTRKFDNYSAPDSLPKQIWKKLAEEKSRVTVMAVMVQGAPYAEETERRIRDRYAVLAGLRRAGYVPVDPEHIEYLKIDAGRNGPGSSSKAGAALTNIMPYEWQRCIGKGPGKKNDFVALIWINDAVFQEKPLTRLAGLADYLARPLTATTARPSLTIIGPARSGTLRSMLRETFAPDRNLTGFRAYSSVALYSAMATANTSKLLESIPGIRKPARVQAQFSSCGITFKRTILSDGELAKALNKELELRGVNPTDHIVLIAEWDTIYGRSLIKNFDDALQESAGPPNRIHHFSYLRGIDGMLPGDQESAKNDKSDQKNNPLDEIKKLEQPTGKSQYDYLRRLAEQIYVRNQELKESGPGIKAIGVLGSDFYDKYLVLQALRQRFPELVFFTTDLDARLLHPAYIQWTRNLIVAS
ncbi:MAG: hypothetical protein ACOYM3_32225, partial [Terrimicrobiaceae bacterium]